jgi:hypothetical protein
MAGSTTDTGRGGGRRLLDSEINMVPMIDLLMVTIAFLLVTAVWSHMARLEAAGRAPRADPCGDCDVPDARVLDVDMRVPDRFVLSWRARGGGVVVGPIDVPRRAGDGSRFPELAEAVAREWREHGAHTAPTDPRRDEAVLHTADDARFAEIVRAMDAIYEVRRRVGPGSASALAVTLAAR